MFDGYPPKSVVVGLDGSEAAIRAARWAADEIAGTHIPLRLLCITKANPGASRAESRAALAAAEEVVHDAYTAIDVMGTPLKVEMEVIEGQTVPALIAASRFTPLLCVGDTGSAQHPESWLGSTAKEVAQSAHCSVAIVRGDPHDTGIVGQGCIVARVDDSPDDIDVLDRALNEALRRRAPLRVLTTAQSRSDDQGDRVFLPGGIHLKHCKDNYPNVEITIVLLQGSFVDYLAEHATSIQLFMIGSSRSGEYNSSSTVLALWLCEIARSRCCSSVSRSRKPRMRELATPPGSIVVGIDGSKTALYAALWAVDEQLAVTYRYVCCSLLSTAAPWQRCSESTSITRPSAAR
jgi:nucleotide-binding universal stress UspA family protein